jgi:ribonuclease HI
MRGEPPPAPRQWIPKYIPENWVYTDGSDIKGHPRLGAAVVHVPTATTIYIDAAGTDETHTIMRAELVAIHTALSTFVAYEWIGIFTDSLSSLQAMQHQHTHPGIRSARDYHHHRILLESILDILGTRRLAGHRTTLHKIRAHTNIRGNDLADAATKMAVRSFDTLPANATIRVDTGEVAPRPQYWVMYTVTPIPLGISPTTRLIPATNTRAWWTIPESERLQMHAFTRPSQQPRLKVRHVLLRILHYTSLYRRLLVANKLKGGRLQMINRAIHKKLNSTPMEGTSILKFIYGQLYNGKIAMRYGHALADEFPLCRRPDSCTHIAGECPNNEGLRIGRHNAACQLIHAAMRKTSKGGGALHAAPE